MHLFIGETHNFMTLTITGFTWFNFNFFATIILVITEQCPYANNVYISINTWSTDGNWSVLAPRILYENKSFEIVDRCHSF